MAKEAKEEKLGKEVGVVRGYLTNISVAIIELIGTLKQGQKIRIKGGTTDFEQTADSMQVERKAVKEAKKGESIGLKVADRCRDHDKVYIVK